MNPYTIKYRRRWWPFWKTLKGVIGHSTDHYQEQYQYDHKEMGRVVRVTEPRDVFEISFEDGSTLRLHKFSECDLKLGPDYFIHRKKKEEEKAGLEIQTNEKK